MIWASPRKVFSQVGQYALRTVAALALEDEGTCLRADDLAERTGIPSAYLSKVLRRLAKAGLLVSQKGHHGGFRLARVPSRLSASTTGTALKPC